MNFISRLVYQIQFAMHMECKRYFITNTIVVIYSYHLFWTTLFFIRITETADKIGVNTILLLECVCINAINTESSKHSFNPFSLLSPYTHRNNLHCREIDTDKRGRADSQVIYSG